eukprot:6176733-Pleurochrysis_carterae.AAC.1
MLHTVQWCTLDHINLLIADYSWPAGRRPAPIHSSVLKGARGTVPESGSTLCYTASKRLHWAKHSAAFLQLVVKDPTQLFWRSWLPHLSFIEMLLQYEIGDKAIADLGRAIYAQQKLFNAVSQYTHRFNLKYVFAQHYRLDVIRNFGSPRNHWCIRFQAFSQIV